MKGSYGLEVKLLEISWGGNVFCFVSLKHSEDNTEFSSKFITEQVCLYLKSCCCTKGFGKGSEFVL